MAKKKAIPSSNPARRQIKVLGVVILVVVAAIGVFFGGKPLFEQLGDSNGDIAAAQQQTQSLTSQLTKLRNSAKDSSQIETFRKQFVAKFPETADVPTLINNISASAVAAGISSSDITNYSFQAPTLSTGAATGAAAASGTTSTATPSASPSASTGTSTTTGTAAATGSSKLAAMSLNLTVKGTPTKFAVFLKNLTSMDRNFTVTTFSVAGSAAGSTLTLTGTTYLYSHIPTASEGTTGTGVAGAAGGTTGTTGSGTTGSTGTSTTSPLSSLPGASTATSGN